MVINRHEEAQLPCNDLGKEAEGAQSLTHRLGEACEFDAARTHDPHSAQPEPFSKIDDCAPFDQCHIGIFAG